MNDDNKTEGYYNVYNTDDVFLRTVLISLVANLNNKIKYVNKTEKSEVIHTLPFYYSVTGQENFLQDYYLDYTDTCVEPKLVDGNIDTIPRCHIQMGNVSIDSASLVNKFTRSFYTKELKDTLETYSSLTNYLPLNISFNCNVLCETTLESFKILQSLWSEFYKAKMYSTTFNNMRVGMIVGFGESVDIQTTFEFSFDSYNKPTMSFPLELQTWFPVLDKYSERHTANVMKNGIEINLHQYINERLKKM